MLSDVIRDALDIADAINEKYFFNAVYCLFIDWFL